MRNYHEAEMAAVLDLIPADLAAELITEAMLRDPRFARWCTEEAVRQQTAAERHETEALAGGAERWLMSHMRVREVSRSVREITRTAIAPPVRGTAGQTLGEARGYAPLLELPVAAGTGLELWEEVSDTWLRLPDDVPSGDYLALRVRGDSMQPVLHDGDTVLVKVEKRAIPGSIIVARTPDDGYVVKYVESRGMSGLRLASLNPDYPDTIAARDSLAIVGTVIARFAREDS